MKEKKQNQVKIDVDSEIPPPSHTKRKKVKSKSKDKWITREMAEVLGREFVLYAALKDTILFIIFLIIATTINYAFITPSMHQLHQVMNQQLFGMNNFQDVNTAADFWLFMQKLFTRSFYFDYWYFPDLGIKQTSKFNKKILYENKLIGLPRLRQLKVRNDSCPIHSVFKRIFLSCYGRFNGYNEDKSSFGLSTGSAWTYSTSKQLESISYWGRIDWYHGGGYYQDLSREKIETLDILHTLRHNLWITRGTRVVFLDFPVYNANNNLFCVVRAAFEFPPTGGIITSSTLHVVNLLRYSQPIDYFIFALELLHLCFILYYTMEEVREMIHFKWKYFKKFWSYVDNSIILLAYGAIVFATMRTIIVQKHLDDIVNDTERYINLEMAAAMQIYYSTFTAIQLFLIYLKLFKYINVSKSMAQVNNTLSKCRKDMMGFGIMFFVIFIAFAVLGYLIFGTEVAEFSSFYSAMFTLLKTILGDFDYSEIEKANRILAPVFFLAFIFLVFFVLLNMFLAIINDTYTDVKTEIAITTEELSMSGFLKRGYKNVIQKMGVERVFRKKSNKKEQYLATVDEIKGIFKKLGYSDVEVALFFTRYNIESEGAEKEDIIKKLTAVLDEVTHKQVVVADTLHSPVKEKEETIQEFAKQQQKLSTIEELLNHATTSLNSLILRLNNLEKQENSNAPH